MGPGEGLDKDDPRIPNNLCSMGSFMDAAIHRFLSDDDGTFGVFMWGGKPICVTVENPWKDNRPRVSCIPPGDYDVGPHSGLKYKDVWILHGVPGRSAILIHKGNTEKDTDGCIIVGMSFARFGDIVGVAQSGVAISLLRAILPKEFKISIRNETVLKF